MPKVMVLSFVVIVSELMVVVVPFTVKLPVITASRFTNKLAPAILPKTDNDVSVPTVVKLEFTTLLDIVSPVNVLAATLEAATPVSCEPLPRK